MTFLEDQGEWKGLLRIIAIFNLKGRLLKGEGPFLHGDILYMLSPHGPGRFFHHTPDWLRPPSGNDDKGESDGEREWYSSKFLYP